MIPVNLIVVADEPAIFFASLEDAEQWMEAVDVEDGVYRAAFGPRGEPYSITTAEGFVIIRSTGDAPQPEALKAILLRYFTAIGETICGDISLPKLLERCSPSYS